MAAPAWRSQIRRASFRGVAFETQARSIEGGRRVAHHVYPGRDEAYPEDMGRKPRSYSVEAYLVGPDYLDRKKELLAALEAQGPGEYVDRWGETHQVQVKEFTAAENKNELGWVLFRITFIEWAPPGVHTVQADRRAAAMSAAQGAQASVRTSFASRFSALRTLGGWLGSAAAVARAVRAVVAFVRNFRTSVLGWLASQFLDLTGMSALGALSMVTELFGVFGLFSDKVAAAEAARSTVPASERITAFAERGVTSYPTPVAFADEVALVMGAVLAPQAPADRYAAARALAVATAAEAATAAAEAPVPSGTVDAGAAINDLVRGLALTWQAVSAADMQFATYDDAVATRQQVADDIEAYMRTAPDPVYRAMGGLRAAVVADITARGADLTRLTDVTPAATLPALVLAHGLYGDAMREAELLTRNRIRHPGFVPGGRTLKVPSDG